VKAQDERLARAALSRLTEPGEPRLATHVAELGAVVVRDHLFADRDVNGVLSDVAARLSEIDPVRDLENADRLGIRFVIPGDDEWPTQVNDLDSAEPLHRRGGVPMGLWVKGPIRLDELAESIAVVGSRSATSYGAGVAGEIAATSASAGWCVVSGAAFGIDQAAHRGAAAVGGPTVAVLACGVDRAYPAAHKSMLDHLAVAGAVISEAPPGCSPSRLRFLARNRLIAALTRGTVIVEAAVRSGALNTANWADRLSRSLMGVPGPVTSASSQGVHQLLRSGTATLVTSGADVLELVGAAGDHLSEDPRGETRVRDALTLREQQVLDAVPVASGVSAGSLARTAGIGIAEVRVALSRLHRMGLVEDLSDRWRLAAAALA